MPPLRKWLAEDRPLRRIALAFFVALCGLAVGFSYDLHANSGHSRLFHLWVGLAAAIGGFVPGYFLAGWFGRTGWKGWAVAFLSAYSCSAIGGFLAGTLVFPGIGSFIGLIVGTMWFARIETAAVWVLGFILAQVAATLIRRSR